jgi:beta-phosphoglucomutase-like phosphatase (HAD superfamily)
MTRSVETRGRNKQASEKLKVIGGSGSKENNSQPGREQRFDDERRVVLLDLDGTLMDSEKARTEAWRRALRHIEAIVRRDPAATLAAYAAIYNCHGLILETAPVGSRGHVFEDMRQEWNTRMSYALLIAWSEAGDLFPPDAGSQVNHYQRALQALLETRRHRERVLERAEHIANPSSIEYTQKIDQAVEAFWNGNFHLYPGVKELLRELRRKDIEYYVATEGHLPTQWRKICSLGLDQLDLK